MQRAARALAACVLICASITNLRAQPQAEVAALLQRAEVQLAAGDTAGATDSLDRAASMEHAPEIEMGLVRAYMQAGEYRRALAFSAHTAGAHLESAAAAGLYAWLLRAGGQRAVAERTLTETLARWPADPVAREVERAFIAGVPVASAPLLQAPHRMAPLATLAAGQAPVAAGAAVLGSGVLIDAGTQALVPAAGITASIGQRLWVRNGLGQTSPASVEPTPAALAESGLLLLRLAQALPPAEAEEPTPRAPFAGSPGFLIEYAPMANANPAWPTLFAGFMGQFRGVAGLRQLGIEAPDGPHGGPVFDGAGRLAGVAVRGADGSALMVPAALWAPVKAETASVRLSRSLPPDEVYERALRLAVQVMADPAR